MTDFLDVKRKEIADRLKELKPLVDEYTRLGPPPRALDGVGGSAPVAAARAARALARPPARAAGAAGAAATPAPTRRSSW